MMFILKVEELKASGSHNLKLFGHVAWADKSQDHITPMLSERVQNWRRRPGRPSIPG